MNCPKCGDKVDMNAGHVCLTGNDRLKERITYLQARIAELEKLAVVWHKYPDEKPDKDGWYITSYKGQIRRHFWDSRRAFFDTNPTDIPYVENTQPTHYAEYPAPPEE